MAYKSSQMNNLMYSVHFAPRGKVRMVELGRQIAQQYLHTFDGLIGLIGDPGAGKSMLLKGMFPGLELCNDDEGVNVRPLPLLHQEDGFYKPHTYHMDMRFEMAFTRPTELARAVLDTVGDGRRVIVEHFDLLYPLLGRNADLLIGIGEEIIISRPNLFGPEPQDIADVVFHTIQYRKMAHTAEDLCEMIYPKANFKVASHGEVRRGFVRGYDQKPNFDIQELEALAKDYIAQNLPVSYKDETHITIGDEEMYCTGPRMHVRTTGDIQNLRLLDHFPYDPLTGQYLFVGYIGDPLSGQGKHLNLLGT